ncbi:MAG: hypothetical protein M2R45_03960 [Verrucomicrobia subdivision 3 bacterium]|nr:hypothetical protein [Limisphaerales bacterium]MCS1415520.1 hypothetical protein [Limisphaerales bacterium]
MTSNPSRGYVYRGSSAFKDNNAGVRGHLGTVIRTILLDYEAHSLELLGNISHGKIREPIMAYLALLRTFGTQSAIHSIIKAVRDVGNRVPSRYGMHLLATSPESLVQN